MVISYVQIHVSLFAIFIQLHCFDAVAATSPSSSVALAADGLAPCLWHPKATAPPFSLPVVKNPLESEVESEAPIAAVNAWATRAPKRTIAENDNIISEVLPKAIG